MPLIQGESLYVFLNSYLMIPNAKDLKTWVEVDVKALRANVLAFTKKLGKHISIIAVVKSNAYGHGLVKTAQILSGSPTSGESPEVGLPDVCFGVDSVDEALELKKAGIKKPILILGYVPPGMFSTVVQNGFRIAIYNFESLKLLDSIVRRIHKKAFVHFKIETGTFRQGIMREDWPRFAAYTKEHRGLVADGIYTHFSDTENLKSVYYKHQLKNFTDALLAFHAAGIEPRLIHTASTAASMMYKDTYFNTVRLGIGMYGMYPAPKVASVTRIKLRPALTWKTCIAQVKKIQKGDTVGYDRTYKASSSRTIAVLPVGYWDGYDRRFSGEGSVLVRGTRCPIIGRICMNMCMIDVSGVPLVRPGDEVVLLGKQGREMLTAEDLGRSIGTINYEITTRINPLIKRIAI